MNTYRTLLLIAVSSFTFAPCYAAQDNQPIAHVRGFSMPLYPKIVSEQAERSEAEAASVTSATRLVSNNVSSSIKLAQN